MGHSLLNLNIIMNKSLYNLYSIILFYSATLLFRNPRGANYVRTTRDLSPLVLSSKENSVFFTSSSH